MAKDGESDRKRLSIQSLTKVMRKRHQRRKSQALSDDTKISLQPEAKEKTDAGNCGEGQSTSEINETGLLRPVNLTNAVVHTFHGKLSGATSYLVADEDAGRAVVIDPFLDSSGPEISSTVADDILTAVRENHYHVDRILETQGPTAGRSAVWYLRSQLQQHQGEAPRTCAGKSFAGIQRMFERKYAGTQTLQVSGNIEPDFKDGQIFELGSLEVRVLILPARDPEHTAFVIDSNVFIGDALLTASRRKITGIGGTEMVDRTFSSVRKLVSLPPATHIYCSQQSQPFCLKEPWVSVREIRDRLDDPEKND
ncbi:hypothetical protein KC332_g1663 [Hortaea werneckii]|uniref:Metallo-beta-lactamase domain-containing protein n=1 Tax=Hortaea werneckii TaxID=91943 RepID=A0A3M7IK37_HORWE|nr:hypothetical protein KC358_g1555 [Hortaea werneckii]KAI6849587.1 hypothetical protein KC350_g2518 [Hortaea werneckii]KAI6943043.1 hypothetical protein KC341_g1748 [Hortaea werneckii]KAI6943134.1 hypothetical protein KC348_g4324 [Hortaea werneckii]KAI6980885.1 hypothetical protein KC321_g1555 [Hortaea werneckii]